MGNQKQRDQQSGSSLERRSCYITRLRLGRETFSQHLRKIRPGVFVRRGHTERGVEARLVTESFFPPPRVTPLTAQPRVKLSSITELVPERDACQERQMLTPADCRPAMTKTPPTVPKLDVQQ